MTSESKKEKLNKNELLANYQYLMDTIWTIYLEDGSVDILKYSMNPELVNTKQDYTSLANILRNDIYSPDRSLWDETVSLDELLKGEKESEGETQSEEPENNSENNPDSDTTYKKDAFRPFSSVLAHLPYPVTMYSFAYGSVIVSFAFFT